MRILRAGNQLREPFSWGPVLLGVYLGGIAVDAIGIHFAPICVEIISAARSTTGEGVGMGWVLFQMGVGANAGFLRGGVTGWALAERRARPIRAARACLIGGAIAVFWLAGCVAAIMRPDELLAALIGFSVPILWSFILVITGTVTLLKNRVHYSSEAEV